MKLKGEFVLREIAGVSILIPVGTTSLQFNGIISLNETSVEIYNCLQVGATRTEIVNHIWNQFDVSLEVATADVNEFLQKLKKEDLLDDCD